MEQKSLLESIGLTLRARHRETVSEPLPARWIDLLRRLHERERTEGEGEQGEQHRSGKQRRGSPDVSDQS